MIATSNLQLHSFGNGSGLTLNIGIVGAGIAGLTAAAALSRLGHRVNVYERSSFSSEVGAAINVGPNAAPVLRALGFDVFGANFIEAQGLVRLDAHTLEELEHGSFEDFKNKFNAPLYLSHRVDLHNELKRLALSGSDGFPGARLHLATRVIDVDCENGILKFEDGTTVSHDVVIGADGVHSVVAQCVLGGTIPAIEVKKCAFRFLIPTQKLLDNHITKPLFEDGRIRMQIATAPDRRLVFYPCRNGEIQNFVGVCPVLGKGNESEDWQSGGNVQDLLDMFSTFHPILVEICRNAEDLKFWKLLTRSPIRKWIKGKTIIIGDAVHPMLPQQAQGASQGIEDAGALGIFLSNIQSLEDIPRHLELVQNIRRDRTAAIQLFSNFSPDEPEKMDKQAELYAKGPLPKNRAEFQKWHFHYDILSECRKVMDEFQSSKATASM
ncbi:hypothetical protein BGW36DRAFT_352497 [Talaromyces proteolyticus]|uniref:FAD-binding domain-containing protein n=1 Tax=Talaromyces proteolyticus TaxID=1131652 RepID=A0AAD4PUA3_9EURO|nr:uncharacterized protein BGW36DRAFT_352497 [Talaromyces proteolyticus]KAH8689105.1 hypothetical protein BGW36DRAFT_352497 [Talaromyces proteolyticus]